MKTLFFVFTMIGSIAQASSIRTVNMREGEMAQIKVSPRFSTLIKFDAHPEPGLIGDQDAFKVEYMRNMVAVKPLVSKGSTNLFLFTREGQFNFRLVASPNAHDDIVQVKRFYPPQSKPVQAEYVRLIDDLLTKKINKESSKQGITLHVESVAAPPSRSTLLVRFWAEMKSTTKPPELRRDVFSIRQNQIETPIENLYLERSKPATRIFRVNGLILIRNAGFKKEQPITLCLSLDLKKKTCDLAVSFLPSPPQR